MAETLPQRSHKRSHSDATRLTRKRGIYYYRRRLPEAPEGEIAVSLRTKDYREAEYLVARLETVFNTAVANVPPNADLQEVLRDYLRAELDADLDHRLKAKPGLPVYSGVTDDLDNTPAELDLEFIDGALSDAVDQLQARDFRAIEPRAAALMKKHGIPEEQRKAFCLGLLEADVKALQEIRIRLDQPESIELLIAGQNRQVDRWNGHVANQVLYLIQPADADHHPDIGMSVALQQRVHEPRNGLCLADAWV